MTFLQLCQRVRQECGISGTGPSTVASQTGEMKRLVDWVSQAWVEIQELRPDWEFMRKSFEFNTTAGKQSYHPEDDLALTDFGQWRDSSFRNYVTATGYGSELFLQQYPDFSSFRDYYLYGTRRLTQARPTYCTIGPDKSLWLGFTPDDDYTVVAEYYASPQELSLDADEPTMPTRFHMLIVYAAMIKYGYYESAQEQITVGQTQYNAMLNKLMANQLPSITSGGSAI